MLVIQYQTVGTEVYESENGPTIGYDNIVTGFVIVPDNDDVLCDLFDPETTRSVIIVHEQQTLGL